MNIIKGLITKDLLQLKSYIKTLIVFMFIFIITSITQENIEGVGSMLTVMITLGFGMFSMATFSYDETAKADRYILALPLTKKEVVLSKYILVICSTLVGSILGVLLSVIIAYTKNQEVNIYELLSLAIGGILGIGIVEGIQIPCIYKFGAEKGRMIIFIVVAILAFLIGGIFLIEEKLNINILSTDILNLVTNFLPVIIILVTVAIYFISYKIAYKIYIKNEI